MLEDEPVLIWLSKWYLNQCDGDWEHDNGITINTLDNPGWDISININGTLSQLSDISWTLFEKSETDWYGFCIENGIYKASGDPSKLQFLLEVFRDLLKQG